MVVYRSRGRVAKSCAYGRTSMTHEALSFCTLTGNAPDADLPRWTIAEHLIAVAVSARTGAVHGEQLTERIVQRAGMHEREPLTRVGTADSRIPNLHDGAIFRAFWSPNQWRSSGDPRGRRRRSLGRIDALRR